TLAAVAPQATRRPAVPGTAEPGSTVVVTDEHGNTLCTVQTVPDDGHWSCTSASALADGTHTITATATDEAGNSASAHEDVTIDTHAPDAPTLAQVASPTANTLPTFSGTSEAGSTVAVIENGAVLCTALVAGDGTWACTSTVALTGGPATHTVDAVSTDPAGNVSQASGPMSFVVDTRTPTTPTFDQPDSPSNDPQQTLTGTAQSGATVVVKDGDGNVICTATAHADGTWSCTATLPEGSTDLTATSTLGTGPVSPPTGVHTIVIDTQAPAAPALTGPTAPVDTTTPVLHGTGEAGATVTVTDTDTHQVLCTAVVQSDGTWSCSAATLPQGATHVSVAQQDPAGNDSTSVTGVVVVDTIPPTVAIAAQGAPSNQPTQTLSGTAEAGSTVTVTSGAGGTVCVAVALSNGTWACSATLPEGQTNVSATAQDAAGNTATAGPVAYVIDTIPPTVPQIDTPDSPTSDTTPTFTGTGEAGTSVVVTEGATVLCTATVQNDGTWSCDSTVVLPGAPETHTITATGVDEAGNTSNGTTTTTVTVDTHVPVDPTIDPVASPTNDTSVTLTGTAEAGDTVVVTDGHGGTLCTTVAQSDGTWSCDVTLPDGSTTITATATTPAGVSGSDTATTTVVVDTTPPAVPTLAAVTPSPSNNTTPTFHGTGEAGSTVTVTEGSTVLCTAVVAQNGTWTCVSSALTGAPATNTVTATATDSAGNTSAASAPQSFVVDTRSPGAPTLAQVGSPTTNTQQTLTGTGAV
ncbi:MAG: hypothetical protein JST92_26080, partial [Deltaproteobacteria bacterium]|nr:hypothetical protein [Deltaproteobacteria bacterium]